MEPPGAVRFPLWPQHKPAASREANEPVSPPPESPSSGTVSPLVDSLRAQQLAHQLQKRESHFPTVVTEQDFIFLKKFIETASLIDQETKTVWGNSVVVLNYLYKRMQAKQEVDPEHYLQLIHGFAGMLDTYCSCRREQHHKENPTIEFKEIPVISESKFDPVYQAEIHPAFTVFQRYVNFFFADLRKSGLLKSTDDVGSISLPKNDRIRFYIDQNGYVPFASSLKQELSCIYLRYGENAFNRPEKCGQRVLLFQGDELEEGAGFLLRLNKKPVLPGLPAIPSISMQGRYGITNPSPYFLHEYNLIADLESGHPQTKLFKTLFKGEIETFFSGNSTEEYLYLLLPDFSLEGAEFAYLYLEELLQKSQDHSSTDRQDAIAQIELIAAVEEGSIEVIMKELKDEIIASLEVPEAIPAPPVPKQTKGPAKPKLSKNQRKKGEKAEEAERKAAREKRLEEKFETYMQSKRVKLRKATKLFNAVFKSKPDLKVIQENRRGSHAAVKTTEGSATLPVPHGNKRDFNKRPLQNFIHKISNAVPEFMGKKD